MTVRELIELNAMITDVSIVVRQQGSRLVDALYIGLDSGVKPPHPMRVPKTEKDIGNANDCTKKDATYIRKSINSWDDGKDYWEIKVNRIPSKWLDLQVYSWNVQEAYFGHHPRACFEGHKVNNFYGKELNITAEYSGADLQVEEKPKQEEVIQLPGQMTLQEWLGGTE